MAAAKPTSAQWGAPADQRIEGRTSTLFRPVLIETDAFAGFCLVRNISPSGLMGEVYTSLTPDTPALLSFEPNRTIHGCIKWCRDGRIGIEFDKAIDVAEILAAVGAGTFDGKINRAPRLAIQIAGEVIVDQRAIPIEIQNISQRGLRVRATYLQPGEEVEIRITGMRNRKAIVRWTQQDSAGLNFITPLPFVDLAKWIIETHLTV